MFRPLIAAITLATGAICATDAAEAQSCTVIPISYETSTGAISGYVLDNSDLCYFIDQTGLRGEARLITDNACFTVPGVGHCARQARFDSGQSGAWFHVEQERLQAGHARFTLQISLD